MNGKKLGNVMWGIILLIIAAVLVLYKMDIMTIDIFPNIALWKLIVGILLAVSAYNSLVYHRSHWGFIFSLAGLGIVFGSELHIEKLVPWTILLVALLVSIAVDLILGKNGNHSHSNHNYYNGGAAHNHFQGGATHGSASHGDAVTVETVEGDVINEKVSFTGVTKYIHSNNFLEANLDCSFCGAEFFFDNVTVPSGKAEITLKSNFCGVTLYVPRNWTIINEINSFLGAVDIDCKNVDPSVATVTLKGSNSFAGVEIKRV